MSADSFSRHAQTSANEDRVSRNDLPFPKLEEVSMDRKTFPFLIMLALLLPLMATHVVAQKSHELVANIPFDFTVCREQLPAGKYKVRPISGANPKVVLVASEDNRSVEIVCTRDVKGQKPAATGKLIFNRYGNQYFLSELWLQGDLTGNQLVKTEQEEALLREVTGVKKREKVTVKVTEAKPN